LPFTEKAAMTDYPEILVLRHGQTEWNSAGRYQGRLDSPLSDLGRTQARQQGRILARELASRSDIGAYCSPQGRALATAKLVLKDVNLQPRIDERLREISFGQWEGLTFDDIATGWPERVLVLENEPFQWNFQAPGGESFDQICKRAVDFLGSLSGPVVITTHGITSRILRGLWLGGGIDVMAALPGGQGCVYHLKDGEHQVLR
jgi:glucosyl-3-phosphoglycerate phosphatase